MIETFTRRPADLDTGDIHRARIAGLSDEAIRHVFDVAAMFNVIDRLADALAFHVPDQQTFEKDARILLRFGYRFPRFLWPRPST